jgi:DNA repair exonuclease SbcCD ATPase subunit
MFRITCGYELPFDAFSTAEGMGAAIIIRLLAAQMATEADFCCFDELLEHLDPEVRRRVANILSRATSGEGPLRQVVVTTYEEQLATTFICGHATRAPHRRSTDLVISQRRVRRASAHRLEGVSKSIC